MKKIYLLITLLLIPILLANSQISLNAHSSFFLSENTNEINIELNSFPRNDNIQSSTLNKKITNNAWIPYPLAKILAI